MRTIKQLKILISGGPEIERVLSLFISQKVNWHHTFDVAVRRDDFSGNFEECLGKPIHIEFQEAIEEKTFANTFSGVITEVARSSDAISGETVILRGKSPSFYMEGSNTYRSFLDTDLRKVLYEIFQPYSTDKFSSSINPTANPQIPYIIQYRESDFHFLSRLAARWGQWFYFNGSDLYFGKRASDQEVELLFNKTLSRADLELRLLPSRVTNYAYEYIKNEAYQYDSAKADMSNPGKYAQKALAESERLLPSGIAPLEKRILEKQELENATLVNKSAQVGSMIVLLGTSDNPALRAGQTVAIIGAGEPDGRYIIHAVSHRLDTSGNYENNFEAVPAGITVPPLNPYIAEPLAESQIATVIDNKDPEKLGRIKVRFIWDQQPTTWLRILTPHAGPDRGCYFIPEIDDQVLVGFEFNNPDCPYVIGSLFHGAAKPQSWQDQKNNKKAIRTKSGNEICFNDEAGKEEINIRNKDSGNEMTLSLSGEGKITIKSKGTLELSGRKISIKAQQSLECEAQASLAIKAANTSIESSGKLEINGGGLAEIKAGLIKLN